LKAQVHGGLAKQGLLL